MDTPKLISKYEVIKVLGQGAMGVVFLAHDRFVDRNVAIKLCDVSKETESISDTDQMRTRRMFLNEARAAGALDHPNIVRVHDAGEVEDEPYIVMEYVEGGKTLAEHCKPDVLLPIREVLKMVAQAAEALDYAHSHGVTHRDIKPANLLVTSDGILKIADFGIAQQTQSEHTQLAGAFGSPRYMSPEQVQDKSLTSQTDLYSLGVVLYELIAGQPPFTAETLGALTYRIMTEEAPPLRELRPDAPSSLFPVVERAMHKSLAERYQTGAEMARDLYTVLDDITNARAQRSEADMLRLAGELNFFSSFSENELQEVLDTGSWEFMNPGSVLIRERDDDRALYILVSGKVAISVNNREIGVLGRGECVGEMSYLAGTQHSATVSALDPLELIRIDEPLSDWASIPCQMKFNKIFQRTLIERLTRTSQELSRRIS